VAAKAPGRLKEYFNRAVIGLKLLVDEVGYPRNGQAPLLTTRHDGRAAWCSSPMSLAINGGIELQGHPHRFQLRPAGRRYRVVRGRIFAMLPRLPAHSISSMRSIAVVAKTGDGTA